VLPVVAVAVRVYSARPMPRLWATLVLTTTCAVAARAHEPPAARVTALEARKTNTAADVDILLQLAQTQRVRGNAKAALVSLEEAWGWQPDDARVLGERGLAHSALGNDAKADVDLTAALAARPQNMAWRLEHARVLARLGRVAEALEAYAVTQDGKPDVDALLEHGRLLERQGRHQDAARVFHAGVMTAGGAAVLRKAAVVAYANAGDCAAALRLIRAAPRAGIMVGWMVLEADVLDAQGRSKEATKVRAAAGQQLAALQQRRETPDRKAWAAQLAFRAGQVQQAHALLVGLPDVLDAVREARAVVQDNAGRWTCAR